MHLLIHTYFDSDGLLTGIDVSEQQVSYRSLYGEKHYVRVSVREFDFRGLNSRGKDAKGVKA